MNAWARDMVPAAEEGGWAVTMIDARASLIVLEEPIGSGGVVLRISGKALSPAFIRAMSSAHRPGEVDRG